MATAVMASSRGEVTLSTATRDRLGIKGGGVVIVEDRRSEIVLKPGVVLELDLYEDDQIAQRDARDRLEDEERQRLAAAVAADPGPPVRCQS